MTNYVKELNTLLFRKSWSEMFRALSDEDAGILIKAVYDYADDAESVRENAEEHIDTYQLKCFYERMKRQLNQSSKRYIERREEIRKGTENKNSCYLDDSSQGE